MIPIRFQCALGEGDGGGGLGEDGGRSPLSKVSPVFLLENPPRHLGRVLAFLRVR